jgi:hypothetical protein
MEESIEAFDFCQELHFLDYTNTPILQTDASDYGVGGYMFMVINEQVRVVRFFSKSLTGLRKRKNAMAYSMA